MSPFKTAAACSFAIVIAPMDALSAEMVTLTLAVVGAGDVASGADVVPDDAAADADDAEDDRTAPVAAVPLPAEKSLTKASNLSTLRVPAFSVSSAAGAVKSVISPLTLIDVS